MKRKIVILVTFSLFVMIVLRGILINSSRKTFSIDQFQNALKDKGYSFEVKEVNQFFLPTTRKKMTIGSENIYIYVFDTDRKMEKEAEHIYNGGGVYDDGKTHINYDGPSYKQLYKRGSIIVEYSGKDEKLISDLKDILGEQYTGGKEPEVSS